MRVVAIVIAGVLVADTIVVLSLGASANTGTLLPAVAGVGLAVWGLVPDAWRSRWHSGWRGVVRKAILVGLSLGAVSFLFAEVLILYPVFVRADANADWVIVLGAGLRGEKPSLTLQRRLERTLTYLQEHPAAKAVLSGGRGPQETITEAEAMYRYLVGRGVPGERLLKEEKASSTIENLRFSVDLIQSTAGKRPGPVAVISSEFHLFRVKLLARRIGPEIEPVAASTPWYLLPNCLIREYFAVVKSVLVDR